MTAGPERCPQCDRALPRDAPRGLCRHCLFNAMIGTGNDEGPIELLVPPQTRFGDYELGEILGRGGMGVVYRARQLSLNRMVALKMIHPAQVGSEGALKRFHAEAEAAARLEHQHIVPIYEIGERDGQPYFTMKLIEGGTLAARMNWGQSRLEHQSPARGESSLDLRSSVRAITKVARAVHYAHQRGILHRDLKPANILLDGDAQPHITDFGLAKQLEDSLGLTVSGAALGTPNYMSPEQAAGRSNEITTATDVYSLGAIIYELLAGQPPFAANTPLEVIRRVVDEEVERPSSVRARNWRRHAERRSTNGLPAQGGHPSSVFLRDSIDRDLETICLKCLEKNPSRRYVSAEALADDLDRWLRHEPVAARPSTAWERSVKWMRRKPALAGLLGVSVLAVITVVTVLALSREEAIRQEEQTSQQLYAANMYLAQQALDDGNLALARSVLANYQTQSGKQDLRGFEWRYLWRICQGEQVRTLRGHSSPMTCVAFSPDGAVLLTGAQNSRCSLWDVASGHEISSFVAEAPAAAGSSRQLQQPRRSPKGNLLLASPVTSVAWSPDGELMAIGNSSDALLYHTATRQPLALLQNPAATLAFVPHSSVIALAGQSSSSETRSIRAALFDWKTLLQKWERQQTSGAPRLIPAVRAPRLGTNNVLAVARNGKLLATSDGSNRIELRGPSNAPPFQLLSNAEPVALLACSSNGQWLAVSSAQTPHIRLWSLLESREVATLEGHIGRVWSMAFSPDGQWLASGGADQSVRVWDIATRTMQRRFVGHLGAVRALEFTPDGQQIASASDDATARFWNLTPPPLAHSIQQAQGPFVFSRGGDRVAGRSSTENILAVWELTTGKRTDLGAASRKFLPLFFSNNGQTLTAADVTGEYSPARIAVFDLASKQILSERALDSASIPTNISPDIGHSANIAVPRNRSGFTTRAGLPWALETWANGTVRLWNVNTAELRREMKAGYWPHDARFSPDGRRFTLVTAQGHVSVWNADTGQRLFDLSSPQGPQVMDTQYAPDGALVAGTAIGNSVVFCPDGRWLASGGHNNATWGTIHYDWYLWEAASGKFVASLAGHKQTVHRVAFSADGRTVASASHDGSIKLWHIATRREIATLARQGQWEFLEFSPDGRYLIAEETKHRLRIWEAPPFEELELAAAEHQ